MNKARLVATSGICAAVASSCLLITSVFPYVALILSVVCAIAVVMPMLIEPRNLTFSLLVYAVCLVVGGLSGSLIRNIVYVAPIVTFCLPLAIVKVYGESKVSVGGAQTQVIEDPFDENGANVVVEPVTKMRLPRLVKWILYYLLLEVGVGLTVLATYLVARPVFNSLYAEPWLFWLVVGAAQLAVPLYDLLLHGCLIGTNKVLKRVIK